jgi:SAM-dependent methyltransferase
MPTTAPIAVPTETPSTRSSCPICGGDCRPAGQREGRVIRRPFHLLHCPSCDFYFVADPTDRYDLIYDEAYYSGRGADPLIDYLAELDDPASTVRRHEWAGTCKLVDALVGLTSGTRWLDFGCGNGGQVRFARQHASADVVGYDIGWITGVSKARGIPILSDAELAAANGTFDVATALEVIEHVPDPVAFLRQIYSALKPGGMLYFTTGNVEAHRHRLLEWSYVVPDLHVSFFTPKAADVALKAAGFEVVPFTWRPGCREIIRFKTLKNLGFRRNAWWQGALPWTLLSPVLASRFKVFSFPLARKPLSATT